MAPYVEEMKRGEEEAKQFARDNAAADEALRELTRAVEENSAMLDSLIFEMRLASEEETKLRDHSVEAAESLGHLRDESLEAAAAERELSDSSRKASENLDLMGLSGAGTAGKLVPLLAGIGGLIALGVSVAPAFAAAGLGLAAFGAMALPTLSQIKNGYTAVSTAQQAYQNATTAAARSTALAREKNAWAQMSPPIAAVVREIMAFKSQYTSLAQGSGFQTAVLQDIQQVFQVLRELLPVVVPLAQQGAIAVHQLLSALSIGIHSAGFLQFMQTMTQLVVPAMAAIRNLVGALMGLLGNALVDLAPLAVPLLNMLAGLVRTLSGPIITLFEAFQRVLADLLQVLGPVIGQLGVLGSQVIDVVVADFLQFIPIIVQVAQILFPALMQVLTDLLPILENALEPQSAFLVLMQALVPVLRVVAAVLTWLASLLAHPLFAQLIVDVIDFIIVAKGVIAILGLVSRAFGLLGLAFEATPVGWIITAIAAVVFAFYELWTHCAAFRNFWEGLWRDILAIAAPVVGWIKNVLSDMSRWWTDHGHTVMAIVHAAWTYIAANIKVDMAIIETVIKVTLAVIEGVWKASWEATRAVVVAVWQVIHAVIYAGIHTIYDVIMLIMNLIEGHWGAAWHNVTDIAHTQMNLVVSIIRSVVSGFYNLLFQAGASLIHGLIGGIESAVGGLWSTVQSIGSGISSVFSSVLHILSPSLVFAGHGRNVILGLIQGLMGETGPLQSAMNYIGNLVASSGPRAAPTPYGAYAASAAAPAYAPYGGAAGGPSGNLVVQVSGQTLFEISKDELYRYNIRNSGAVTGVAKPS